MGNTTSTSIHRNVIRPANSGTPYAYGILNPGMTSHLKLADDFLKTGLIYNLFWMGKSYLDKLIRSGIRYMMLRGEMDSSPMEQFEACDTMRIRLLVCAHVWYS